MTAFRDHIFITLVIDLLLVVTGVLGELQCAMDYPSGLQWDVFYGGKYNVVSEFCNQQQQDEANPLNWKVNTNGNRLHPIVKGRSPPVTPSTYRDLVVQLIWTPHKAFAQGSCLKGCFETYQEIAQSYCGHTGGESNLMAENGTWSSDCGQYSWVITQSDNSPPTAAPRTNMTSSILNTSSRVATAM
ncbi:hypothetical protein LZ31DRAFT_243312 [Colletotrichum somersetense]|nr:hypothetical protein LZ31DRAFT_243312 [Colletotrichum somersetense]